MSVEFIEGRRSFTIMGEPIKYDGNIIGAATAIIYSEDSKIIYIDKISINVNCFNGRYFHDPVFEIDFRESQNAIARQINCSIYFRTGQVHHFQEDAQWISLSDLNCKVVYKEVEAKGDISSYATLLMEEVKKDDGIDILIEKLKNISKY